MLIYDRCFAVIRNNHACSQSTANEGPAHSADRCHHLGPSAVWYVQLLDERLQGQEWRVSFLAPAFLERCTWIGV